MGFMFYVGLGVFLIAGVLLVVVAEDIAARTGGERASTGVRTVPPAISEFKRPIDFRPGVLTYALGGIGILALVFLVSNSARDSSSSGDKKSSGASVLTRDQKLANISIGALSWSAEGFGTVMIATFRIDNDNTFPIKDVEVTCIHSGKSGTPISKSTRTVYEWINANSYHYVRDLNMGFFDGQAVRANCYPSNFME